MSFMRLLSYMNPFSWGEDMGGARRLTPYRTKIKLTGF